MNSASLTITGLDALREALKKLPRELVGQATPIVHNRAMATHRDIEASYPPGGTGNLKQHLTLELRGDAVGAGARVVNTARHAYIFERGSKHRQWKNGKNTGAMPAAHLFVPIAIAHRRAMVDELIYLLEQAGLEVSGSTV